MEDSNQGKFVVVPADALAAALQILQTELPMVKVEGVVAALRQARVVDVENGSRPQS
jgi:hypothetical protein